MYIHFCIIWVFLLPELALSKSTQQKGLILNSKSIKSIRFLLLAKHTLLLCIY